MEKINIFKATKILLEETYSLATGPNHYKSDFGRLLEAVFRKDYFTLQTILTLADLAEKQKDTHYIYAGSMLDLSRRVIEDMVYMRYIDAKDKEKYTKQFIDFSKVELFRDFKFLSESEVEIDDDIIKQVKKDYENVSKKLRSRNNWANLSVEETLQWLIENRKFQDKKNLLLKFYLTGNKKNHTSPSDIISHNKQESLEKQAESDIYFAILITYISILQVAIIFVDELENTEKLKKQLLSFWDNLDKLHD